MKNWKVPAVILLLLILAMAVRWEAGVKTTSGSTIVRYHTDRWNGEVRSEILTPNSREERLIQVGNFVPTVLYSERLTVIWAYLVFVSGLWLVISIAKNSPREVKKLERK